MDAGKVGSEEEQAYGIRTGKRIDAMRMARCTEVGQKSSLSMQLVIDTSQSSRSIQCRGLDGQ